MATVKVKLKLRGINALMTSKARQADLDRRARRIAAAAGEGFEAVSRPHKFTARAYVQTSNFKGRKRQAREAVLERALDAGR